jgi:TonB family protein
VRAIVLRLPIPTSRRSRYYAVSGGLHVAFALVLILSPLFRPARATIDSPLVVDVVGALPSPARAEARPEPAKPEPEPEPPPPREPAEGVRAAAEDVPAEPEPKEPETDTRADPEPAAPEPAARPSAEGIDTPAVGGAITSVGLDELEHAWYRDSVIAALQGQWVRPVLERAEGDWAVTVAFEIARDGTARDPRIEVPSGVPSLDRSALRAVADASPFPPLPSSWREPVVTAQIIFRLHPGEY